MENGGLCNYHSCFLPLFYHKIPKLFVKRISNKKNWMQFSDSINKIDFYYLDYTEEVDLSLT